MKELLTIIAGVTGTVGGTLGIITWFKSLKKDNRSFNQLTYLNHIKYSYKKCFENSRCPETDGVNMYYLWSVIENITEFHKHNNKFKGFVVNSNYNTAFIYSDVIKFDHFTFIIWYNQDEEVNNEGSIRDYTEKKHKIQTLKPFFKEFYLSVFENID